MRRDENLLAAVNAGAERDKQILAALNRDDSFKKNVKNIADTLEKKLQHGAARRDKRKNLKDFEIKPDYMDPDPFARGGQAVVKLGEYAAETVCIKCINMVGVCVEINSASGRPGGIIYYSGTPSTQRESRWRPRTRRLRLIRPNV